MVRLGDMVNCTIAELQPLRAEPEDIPLDIVYEDEHVIVVNKPAHLVCVVSYLLTVFLTFSLYTPSLLWGGEKRESLLVN